MTIYRLAPNLDKYEYFELTSESRKILRSLIRDPAAANGITQLTLNRFRGLESRKSSDFPGGSFAFPMFSKQAWIALRPILSYLTTVPAVTPEETYVAAIWSPILDILDEQASKIEWLEEGVAMFVDRYAFKTITASLPPLFRLRQTCSRQTLVTGEFLDTVIRHKLTGFLFEELPGLQYARPLGNANEKRQGRKRRMGRDS